MALSHTSSIGDRQNPIAILESETEDDSSDDGDLSERKVSSLDATFTDAIYQELQDLYLKAQESQSIAAGRKGQLSSKALIHQLLSCDEQVIQEVLKIIAAAAREPNGRLFVTQGIQVFEKAAELFQDGPPEFHGERSLETLRFFCNACVDISANGKKILEIDGLFDSILECIASPEKMLGRYALITVQNITRKNKAAQARVVSSNILAYVAKFLSLPLGEEGCKPDIVTELLWTLLTQLEASFDNMRSFKILLAGVNHTHLDPEYLPIVSVASRLLKRDDWQASVDTDDDGNSDGPVLQLLWQLLRNLCEVQTLADSGIETEEDFLRERQIFCDCLSDLVARDDFRRAHPVTSKSMQALFSLVDPTSSDELQEASLLIMGNFANNDAICIELMANGVPLAKVVSVVEVSNQEATLFAAFAFLRHLLTPQSVRSGADSRNLIQKLVTKGLHGGSSNPLREGSLRLIYPLVYGSQASPIQLMEIMPPEISRHSRVPTITESATSVFSGSTSAPYYQLIMDTFVDPKASQVIKALAARCYIRLLIRLRMSESPSVMDLYLGEHVEVALHSFLAEAFEYLLAMKSTPLSVESWYGLYILSICEDSATSVGRCLRGDKVRQALAEAVVSQEEALRSNAIRFADNVANDDRIEEFQRVWLRGLLQQPQSVKTHLDQSSSVLDTST